jgi:hypothetical protein
MPAERMAEKFAQPIQNDHLYPDITRHRRRKIDTTGLARDNRSQWPIFLKFDAYCDCIRLT